MMTITIAAITIGIAVDNSIHYIYRFKEEFEQIKNYNKIQINAIEQLSSNFKHVYYYSVWFFNLVLSNFILLFTLSFKE